MSIVLGAVGFPEAAAGSGTGDVAVPVHVTSPMLTKIFLQMVRRTILGKLSIIGGPFHTFTRWARTADFPRKTIESEEVPSTRSPDRELSSVNVISLSNVASRL